MERVGEREGIKNWDKVGNKMLLWHGTKPENIVGILQSGFRIAPAGVEGTGSMFGQGIYFADQFNKSFNYTQGINYNYSRGNKKLKKPRKYMFLCEVALGKSKVLYQAEEITTLPNSTHQSVKGVGQVGPNPEGNVYLPNGSIIPLGTSVQAPQPKLNPGQWWQLQHNEYIVYDPTQVRIKYLLELRSE